MKTAIPEVKKKPIRTFFASLFAHLAIKKDIRNKKIRLMSHRDLTTKKSKYITKLPVHLPFIIETYCISKHRQRSGSYNFVARCFARSGRK